ncbi:MAG TPA: PEGA domain-containing protein, partial [Myxococcaceae bacterium]|nr:PEGA domain-containing protein [Myxococcaceae bacterium]
MRARWGLLALAVGGGAAASPSMVVAASGNCKDADLLGDVKLLADALRGRTNGHLLSAEEVAQKLGAEASQSADELQRQVDAAQLQFYQGDRAAAERTVPEILTEAERLPPGAQRWKIFTTAVLLQSQIDRERGKQDAADDAFKRILRLEPSFQLDPDYFAPSVRKRFDKLRSELARSRKEALAVRSTPSGAEVFLDGRRMGQTPFSAEVVAGSYQ